MPILRKLKSLLGVDDGEDDAERDVTVTVEHDPENEAAVKGAEVEDSSPSGDGDGSTVEAESAAEGSAAEEADVAEDAAESRADEADEETPDEVEIPDAEEPAAETTDEAASEESETSEEPAAAEEDADAEAEDEGADAGEPVDVLNGIGPAYAQRLGDAGVDTVPALADADAAELSDATEIAEGRIQNWIDQAAEY